MTSSGLSRRQALWTTPASLFGTEPTFRPVYRLYLLLCSIIFAGSGPPALNACTVVVHAFVSAASGPLALLFFLVCLIFWVRYRKGANPALSYTLSLVFMSLALLTKEEAVAFPAALALTDMAFRPGGSLPVKRRLIGLAPFFVLLAVYVALLGYLLSRPGADYTIPGRPAAEAQKYFSHPESP